MKKFVVLFIILVCLFFAVFKAEKPQAAAFGYSYHDYTAMIKQALGKPVRSVDQIKQYNGDYQINYTTLDGKSADIVIDQADFKNFAEHPEARIHCQKNEPAKRLHATHSYQVIKGKQLFEDQK